MSVLASISHSQPFARCSNHAVAPGAQRIPGRDSASLTSLAWVRDTAPGGDGPWRLFSGALDGKPLLPALALLCSAACP